MQVLADLKRRPLQKHLAIMRVLILEILEILEILIQTIGIAGDRPPRYGKKASVGQDRQILPCSGSGEPELQRWAFLFLYRIKIGRALLRLPSVRE